MPDMIEVSTDVVYVRGYSRGAIYNFRDGNIYSINGEACKILETFIAGKERGGEFIGQLRKLGLITDGFVIKPFSCPKVEKKLDFAWLELTESCNLRCIHCYEGSIHKDDPRTRLSFAQWKDVIDQLNAIGCKRVELIGGEPTVYPHFEELLLFAISLGLEVEIFSNLQAFSDRILSIVKEKNITIHSSIYGSSAGMHDGITGINGSFEILMYWLKKLVENNVRVMPAITIMRQNQDDIDGTIELLKSIGIPASRISIDSVRTTTRQCDRNLEPTNSQKNFSLRRKPNFVASKGFFQKAKYANTCLCGKFSIHSDGVVSPCEFSRDISYGNVKDEKIVQILESETLNKFWYFDFSKIGQCKGCEYRFACKDCRMLLDEQTWHRKNPRCLYNPVSGIWGDTGD